MKRILEMFGEPITYGGQESVVYNMLSTFNLKNNFKVDLFTPYFADNKYLLNLISDNGGNVFKLNKDFKINDNRFLLTWDVNNFFSQNNNYDVVHIHTGSLSTMCVYAKAAKKYGVKKVIVHAHTIVPKLDFFSKIRRYILCKYLKRYADIFFVCSKTVENSKFTHDILKQSKIVYNGIDIERFKFNNEYRNTIREQYNINDCFLIGSLGRLSFEKNNLFMLDIIKELSQMSDLFKLIIVGTGNLEGEVKKKCYELNLNDKVIFAGNQADTNMYYCAFDCFILPSIYEGMPVTAIEAQISGLPTLISDRVTTDVSISSECKFVSIVDSRVWVNCIKNFFTNKENGYNRTSVNIDYDKFDRNKTFKIVENIYNE